MWSIVAKKEANCDRSDPDDDREGDYWDHVALDPEHRLVLEVVPGARTIENTEALVAHAGRRTGGRLLNLLTSDGYPPYEAAIRQTYGETVTPPRTGEPGRPKAATRGVPEGLTYAVVEKTLRKGRVVGRRRRVVFGTWAAVALALGMLGVSRAINTAFIERENGTARHRNSRKVRRSYRFSKGWRPHEVATFFAMYSYNSCRAVRTLKIQDEQSCWRSWSSAMAAGRADHVWLMDEWLAFPVMQR